jgi:hypothetical protein
MVSGCHPISRGSWPVVSVLVGLLTVSIMFAVFRAFEVHVLAQIDQILK